MVYTFNGCAGNTCDGCANLKHDVGASVYHCRMFFAALAATAMAAECPVSESGKVATSPMWEMVEMTDLRVWNDMPDHLLDFASRAGAQLASC